MICCYPPIGSAQTNIALATIHPQSRIFKTELLYSLIRIRRYLLPMGCQVVSGWACMDLGLAISGKADLQRDIIVGEIQAPMWWKIPSCP